MQAMRGRQDILSELRAAFAKEWATDFSQLHRIPSTSVRKFVDYFCALSDSGKNALADALAERSFDSLFPNPGELPLYQRNEAIKKYVDTIFHMRGRRYQDVRALRNGLALAKQEPIAESIRPRRPRMAYAKPLPKPSMSDEKKKWIEAIEPVKSTDVRKRIKKALSQVLLPLTVTHEGQYWEHAGNLGGQPIVVTIDTSNRYHQLNYWVSLQNQRYGFFGSNYEGLMGISSDWDLLEGANLDQSITLLCEHMAYCAKFLQQLPDPEAVV